MRKALVVFLSGLFGLGFCTVAAAQEAVIVDPTHHKLEFENNCVLVVRGNFGPHEKADAMFDTRDAVIVDITGSQGFKLNLPDGKSVILEPISPGQVHWAPKGRIQPENPSEMRVEYIAIEPKGCN